jgi:signal transduction histidine kinase
MIGLQSLHQQCEPVFAGAVRLLVTLVLLFAGFHVQAQAQVQPTAQMQYNASGFQELSPFIAVWSTAATDASVQDAVVSHAAFSPAQSTGAALGFGFVRQPVWLRFNLENQAEVAQTRIIELAYAHILEVDYFELQGEQLKQVQHVGSARPIYERQLQGRHTAFSISLEPHTQKQVFLRLYSHHPLIVPLRLWEPDAYAAYVQKDWAIQAWYFGIACAMLVFNALLLIALRDRIYLLYTVWIVCITMTIAIGVGVAKLFLWPHSQWWASYANAVFDNWSMAALLQFLRVMLNLRDLQRRVDTAFKYLVLFFIFLPLAYLVDFQTSGQFVLSITLACGLGVLGIAVYGAYRGQRSAWLFLLAFSTVLAAGIVGSLWGLNLLPTSFWTVYGLQVGSAVEMVLLALALADRFNESRRAVLKAQREALAAQKQLVESLRTSERELEERVANRTNELQTTLNQLQRAQTDLIQSEKMASLGALVAGVAHELNTPIGNVLTVASTLQHESIQLQNAIQSNHLRKSVLQEGLSKMQQMADLILSASHKAASLVSSFKRVAVDQTSEQKREFVLSDLVNDVVVSLQPSFKTRPVTIEVHMAHDIRCDSYPGPLGQLLTNLIQNAMLHAYPDITQQGNVIISAEVVDDVVQLCIADDGVGMTDEIRSRVFDPFFTTRLGQGGSGLGLSIAANIVSAILGGNLRVESSLGRGSRFIASFPATASSEIVATAPVK